MSDSDRLKFAMYLQVYAVVRGGGDMTSWAKMHECSDPEVAAILVLAADDAARGMHPRRWDQVREGAARIIAPSPGAGAPPAAG